MHKRWIVSKSNSEIISDIFSNVVGQFDNFLQGYTCIFPGALSHPRETLSFSSKREVFYLCFKLH